MVSSHLFSFLFVIPGKDHIVMGETYSFLLELSNKISLLYRYKLEKEKGRAVWERVINKKIRQRRLFLKKKVQQRF
jgi:hypothetical protein